MAAKIGLVLALDGEKEFTAAMRNANKESKLLKAELNNVKKAFDGEANSMAALTAKQQTLTKQQDAYKRKVDAAKAGLENAKDAYNKQAEALEDLRKRLDEARQAQQKLEDSGDKSSSAYRDQAKRVEELESAVKQQSQQLLTASGRVTDWNTQLAKSEGELRDCNQALNKNEQYMKEAATAADGCATSIDEMGKEAKESADETDKLSISLGDMVKAKAVDLAGDALMALKDKAIDAAKAVVEIGSNFEAQMSKVQAISGASGSDLDALTSKAREMGSSTKFTATEAGEALEYMAMAGWKTNDMIDGLEGIMYLAAASGEDLGTTSDIVTDALTAFGMEAKDSGHFADILATASSNANTNVAMMGETFKYVAPVAGSMGIKAEDAAQAIGIMANAGIKSSQAGTSLRSILTRLATDAGASSTKLGALGTLTEEMGVQFYNADGSVRNLNDVLADARVAWAGLTAEEQANYGKTIAGQNALSGWLALMNAAPEDVGKLQEALENCDGAAEGMAETMNDNLLGDVAILQSAAEELGLKVYDHISGPLRDIVQTATDVINGISDAITPQKTALEKFIEDTQQMNQEARQAIANAETAIAQGESKVAEIDSLAQIIRDADEAFGLFAENDVSAVAENVGSTTTAVGEALEGENEALGTAGEALGTFAGTDTSGLSENVGSTAEGVNDSLSGINDATDATKEKLEGVGDFESPDMAGKFDGVTDEVGKVEEAAGEANDKLADIGSADPQSVDGKFDGITDEVGEVGTAADGANEKLGEVGSIDAVPASGAFDDLKGELRDLGDAAGDAGAEMDTFTKYEVSNAVQQLAQDIPALSDAWDEVTGTLKITEEEFNSLIDTQKRAIMETALEKAKVEATEGWTKALLAHRQAQDAVNAAEQDLIDYMEANPGAKMWEETTSGAVKVDETMSHLQNTLNDAQIAWNDSKATYDEASAEMEKVDKAAEGLREELGLVSDETENTSDAVESAAPNFKDMADAVRNGEMSLEDYQQALEDAGWAAEDIDAEIEDLSGSMEDMGDAAEDAAKEVQKAYDDIRSSIQSSIEKAAESFETFDKEAHSTLTAQSMSEALESQIQAVEIWQKNMETLAGKIGQGMSQELYDTLAQQGPEQSYDAVQALVAALEAEDGSFESVTEKWGKMLDLSDAVGDSVTGNTEAGKQLAEALDDGFNESSETLSKSAETAVTNAANAAKSKAEEFKPAGSDGAKKYAEGIKSTENSAKTQGEQLASAAASGASSKNSSFTSAGSSAGSSFVSGIASYYGSANSAGATLASNASSGASGHSLYQVGYALASGFASGINAGAYLAINAAASMGKRAVQASKDAIESNSPSKLAAREVGLPLSQGIAVGIKQGESDVVNAAQSVADKTVKAFKASYKGTFVTDAKGFLEELKLVHDMTAQEEADYWKSMAQAAKKGSAEYAEYMRLANSAAADASTISDKTLQKKVGNDFGVSKTKTTGSGKNKKDVTKSSSEYWAEVVKEARQYLSNMSVIYDISAEQEAKYWDAIAKKTKKGTQAYYDALSYKKSAEEKAQSDSKKLQDDILRAQQNYVETQINANKMSTADAIAYWQKILKTYEKGTAGYRTVKEEIKTLKEQEREERKTANEKILSDAEAYVNHRKILHGMDADEELAYWESVIKTLKKGSEEWYTTLERIKDLRIQIKEEVAQAEADARQQEADDRARVEENNAELLSDIEKTMERRKILHDVSTREELEYWQKYKNAFAKGSDEWYEVQKHIRDLSEQLADENRQADEENVRRIEQTAQEEEKVYSDRLAKYEKTVERKKVLNGMSTAEELKFWKKRLKNFKEDSDEYLTVYKKIADLEERKSNETKQKRANLLSKYKDDLDKQKILNDVSVADEIKYWNEKIKSLKKGTDEWYEVMRILKDLNKQRADEEAAANAKLQQVQADNLSKSNTLLSNYKTYYKMSSRAEMQYWDTVRKQFKVGTKERIEADQNYFTAKQTYYDELAQLDQDYADRSKEINEKMRSDIDDLNKSYKDAVSARKSEILSSMNLFEAWDSTGYTGDVLLRNLKTQVSGLALWEQQLEELSRRGLSEELMDELRNMGPDAAANIYSLNQMTDKELTEYQKLWEEKNRLALSQAVKDNEKFRKETNDQIAQIRKDAQAELQALNTEYKANVAELNKGISTELQNLANNVANIAEDAIAGLVAGLKNQASSEATKQGTQVVVDKVSGGLSSLPAEGKVIGQNTLDGILAGLMDTKKIESASVVVVDSIKRAMQGVAQIHSPSKLFQDEVGEQIGAGIAEGMSGSGTMEAVRQSVRDMLDAVKKEVMVDQTVGIGGIDFAGINQMQKLTAHYVTESPTVNVNNDGSNKLLAAILGSVGQLQATMDAGIVLDDGTIIGRYQPAFSRESAAVTVRRNRGRM